MLAGGTVVFAVVVVEVVDVIGQCVGSDVMVSPSGQTYLITVSLPQMSLATSQNCVPRIKESSTNPPAINFFVSIFLLREFMSALRTSEIQSILPLQDKCLLADAARPRTRKALGAILIRSEYLAAWSFSFHHTSFMAPVRPLASSLVR